MRIKRTFPCVVLAALILVGFATTADAQTRSTIGGPQFDLQLATNSRTALKGEKGMSWDQFRSNGLKLNARGLDKGKVVVHFLEVKNGRVINRWNSSALAAGAGSVTIAGRQFSAMKTVLTDRKSRVHRVITATRAVATAALLDSDNVSRFLPKGLERGRLLVMFVTTQCPGSGSTTSPLFVDFEHHGE